MYRILNHPAFQHASIPRGTKRQGFCLIIILCLIFFPKCASIHKSSSQKPFSLDDVKNILEKVREQEKKVSSFYSLGSLWVQNEDWISESNILTIGTKNPFVIKMEITHPWGQPLLHILIDETKLEVLSFRENRLYLGPFTPGALSRFLPVDFNIDLIWAALRGYPNLVGHDSIDLLRKDQITLLDAEENEVEIIELYHESHFPKSVSFPAKNISMAFSDFKEEEGVIYAKKVKVEMAKRDMSLVLKNRKLVFNKSIPEQVFVIKKPPTFKTFYLDEKGGVESQ